MTPSQFQTLLTHLRIVVFALGFICGTLAAIQWSL